MWAYSYTDFRLRYTYNALVAIYSRILKRWMRCTAYLSLRLPSHKIWACPGNTAKFFYQRISTVTLFPTYSRTESKIWSRRVQLSRKRQHIKYKCQPFNVGWLTKANEHDFGHRHVPFKQEAGFYLQTYWSLCQVHWLTRQLIQYTSKDFFLFRPPSTRKRPFRKPKVRFQKLSPPRKFWKRWFIVFLWTDENGGFQIWWYLVHHIAHFL